jgi:hypothetical protein
MGKKIIINESKLRAIVRNILIEQVVDLVTAIKEMGFTPVSQNNYKHKTQKDLTLKIEGDNIVVKKGSDEIGRVKTSEIIDLEGIIKSRFPLQEQVIKGSGNDPYEYKKEGNVYYARKKGSSSWVKTSGEASKAIASKIFKQTTTKVQSKSSTPLLTPRFKFDRPVQQSDYLGKGGEFERNLYGGRNKEDYSKMMEFVKKFPPAKKSSLPLHIRALMDYLAGRETPFTASDLTRDEQQFIKKVAISNAKKGLTYPLWKDIGAGNLPTSMTVTGSQKEKEKLTNKGGEGSLIKPELAGQFMYTLGEITPPNIKVSPNKENVTVFDRYDFNTKGKTKEDLLNNFVKQVGSWWKGDSTFYSVIRNAVAFKEANGYKGFPVNITV